MPAQVEVTEEAWVLAQAGTRAEEQLPQKRTADSRKSDTRAHRSMDRKWGIELQECLGNNLWFELKVEWRLEN